MKFNFLKVALAGFILSASGLMSLANAGIVYELDRDIGIGNVSGTITTDGTIGVLASGNVTDWELALFDGTDTFTLYGTDNVSQNSSLLIQSTGFTATIDSLFYNFDTGLALFQSPSIGSGVNWWCLERDGCTGGGQGENLKITGANQHTSYTGTQLIATAVNDVPEPSMFVLFAFGVMGLGVMARRHRS